MARLPSSVGKERRRQINDAREFIRQAEKADCNEAETRRRIERLFENLMGYDPFTHLSRERAVRGAGETEHVDFCVQLEPGEDARPIVMVEIKRVAIDLAPKHLKQVISYSIDAGCEWCLLTNSKDWQLYHITFGQPPETRLVKKWHLLEDDVEKLDEAFDLISLKSLKGGALEDLWRKTNVLMPQNLLAAILQEDTLNAIRRNMRKAAGILLPPEEIVSGIRRLLNESALAELQNMKISLSKKSTRRSPRKTTDKADAEKEPAATPPAEAAENTIPLPKIPDEGASG